MNRIKYLVVEINEDNKTFHFLNEYEDEQTAKNMLNLYLSEVNDLPNKPNLRYEIHTIQGKEFNNER